MSTTKKIFTRFDTESIEVRSYAELSVITNKQVICPKRRLMRGET